MPAFLLGNQKRGTLLSPSGSSRIFSLTFWNLLDEKCSIVPGLWRLWGWTQPKSEYGDLLNDCHSWERGRICRIQDLCTRGPKEREPRHQQLTFIESLFHARGCAMFFYILSYSQNHTWGRQLSVSLFYRWRNRSTESPTTNAIRIECPVSLISLRRA